MVLPMTNLLEQHHTRPRLVAVVGGRRRPAPAVSTTRRRAVQAATRANRDLSEVRTRTAHTHRGDRPTAA